MSDTEKIVACLGGNLDNIRDLVAVPFSQADLHEKTLQVRVFEIGIKLGIKLASDKNRDQQGQQMLDMLKLMLSGEAESPTDPTNSDTPGGGTDRSVTSEPSTAAARTTDPKLKGKRNQ